ncbi:ubiquitin-activating enzyme E1 family protein [Trichomonas vaginalis G3]|uniref:Ubiquitin-activating enzyme E1 family protein n=1 Tax=Trichomonas vaginalis (strain ATCC PRA-98 / G3) TaxID=412133 RepID=A2E718_TRIV3|nr:ubiquitin-activating enzyme E1 family [Trichomonas vaginalis G3]EAY11536.1 ubiquitin-activating enzyme E1 family protein [Trichomonas vaginalis G3]KAI5489420.1 ubiquitin-activating enzyme E1 family [Trichomonas vaginalis G3]|eukprot:XP_001323759.1 ubiquitin-activating enzyme E1 family protein [Trichomonas vaginalis G3]
MTEEVDTNLYSRQIYALGLEAIKKMSHASVLIAGMGGLGVEIAKNIILMGVKNVTIQDTKNTTLEDIASQFYLTESDIGKNRAESSFKKLAELNQHVSVSLATCELTNDFISKFDTIVLTDLYPFSKLLEISDFCHQKNIKLIITQVSGLFGYVFNDFGEKFYVSEPKDEIPERFLIENITQDKDGIVTTSDYTRHGLYEGDTVKFEEVEGMEEVNDKLFTVKPINPYKFSIGDTSGFHPYKNTGSGGYCCQVNLPITMDFPSLRDSLKAPEVNLTDLVFFGRENEVISCFIALSKYIDESKEGPIDTAKFTELAKKVANEYHFCEEISNDVLSTFTYQAKTVITPMCAVFGGIVGQEVFKSISSKFTPIKSYYAISYIESTVKDVKYEPLNDRFDTYRKIFGNSLQDKMMNLKYFMIGAGALGCEILKNWAMMGVFSGQNGHLTITDMDTIELSNLSRQLLFRDRDIGHLKSLTAAEAVKQMSPKMKITAQSNKLTEETRNIYNDEFYESLDGVCNALDNVKTRQYSDDLCVYYNKPLLESGTLGSKANAQIIIPGMTQSYTDTADAEEKSIPQCTLHNFPSEINHCCEWARDIFGGWMEHNPETINKFIKDPKKFIEEQKLIGLEELENNLQKVTKLIKNRPKNFKQCLEKGLKKYQELFVWRINKILKDFPVDSLDENGQPFWRGSKRAPSPLSFNIESENDYLFVTSFAKIFARINSVEIPKTEAEIKEILKTIPVPEKRVKCCFEGSIPLDDLINLSERYAKEQNMVKPESFEKDDDSNSHIDFISAAANLRATNYRIKNESKLEIKRIAGKIIPAIATTTAMICGFVCLEMYKVHSRENRKIEDFRSMFINLSTNHYAGAFPADATKSKLPNGMEITKWNKFKIENMTIENFINYCQEKFGLHVTMINVHNKTLYFEPIQKKYNKIILQKLKKQGKDPELEYQTQLKEQNAIKAMTLIDAIKSIAINGEFEEHMKYVLVSIASKDVDISPDFILKVK